jgi:hypothetical protein
MYIGNYHLPPSFPPVATGAFFFLAYMHTHTHTLCFLHTHRYVSVLHVQMASQSSSLMGTRVCALYTHTHTHTHTHAHTLFCRLLRGALNQKQSIIDIGKSIWQKKNQDWQEKKMKKPAPPGSIKEVKDQ